MNGFGISYALPLIKENLTIQFLMVCLCLVPQNSVVVGPQFGDFFKTKCVYADTGIDIFCKTDFGIKPLYVPFKVGGQVLPLVWKENSQTCTN
ncbi:hypothetical protein MAR_020997 [Mya arenaria]|uniref:Uncharacterized protein n=1 Tax=Mya arenaria TaxID=6604 RepID=A0ABY7E6F4_MYAAR|nr:hypothetical protein MAR_020997 [Mya arenaria]